MTDVVSWYFSPFAPYGCCKEVKAAAVVLTFPEAQDSGEVDDDGFLNVKKKVRFRGWTEIVEGDASTACGLVQCEPSDNNN